MIAGCQVFVAEGRFYHHGNFIGAGNTGNFRFLRNVKGGQVLQILHLQCLLGSGNFGEAGPFSSPRPILGDQGLAFLGCYQLRKFCHLLSSFHLFEFISMISVLTTPPPRLAVPFALKVSLKSLVRVMKSTFTTPPAAKASPAIKLFSL